MSSEEAQALEVTGRVVGRGAYATVYEGSFGGTAVAVKRAELKGGYEVRLPVLPCAKAEVDFGKEMRKAVVAHGPELGKHICYCTRHRVITTADGAQAIDTVSPLYRGTLKDLNKRGFKADMPFVQRVAVHVLTGLEVAPTGKINGLAYVNRDVKPGNLFLEHWDPEADDVSHVTVLIGDWNLARHGDPANTKWSNMTAGMGTDGFRPNEFKTTEYGPRWDVFSLGIVILALVLGRTGEELPGSPSDLLREEVQADSELCDFLIKALESNQERRPDASVLLAHEFLKKDYHHHHQQQQQQQHD